MSAATAEALVTARFKALGDPNRMRIMRELGNPDTELSTGGVVKVLGCLAQPTVSHHLNVLRRAGLITRRKDGIYMLYSSTATGRRLVDVGTSFTGAGL